MLCKADYWSDFQRDPNGRTLFPKDENTVVATVMKIQVGL